MKHVITSKKAYHETMVAIYDLMNKGEANLSAKELKSHAVMAKAVEEYEDNVLGFKPAKEPQTITELLEQKMYEKKMTQAKLADTLGLGTSKLSEILSGKRKPDVVFLKAVYKKLKVDPAFLLDHAWCGRLTSHKAGPPGEAGGGNFCKFAPAAKIDRL